jgi:positive regulator of sigma E activity
LATNTVGAAVGDCVLIEGSHTLLLAAVVYLVPIVLFFIGWFIHPIAGAVGALLGLGGVIAVNRLLQEKNGVSAKIVTIVKKAS